MDDLFELLPEGTRIVIHGNRVTFENLTPDMAEVAHELAPQDADVTARMQRDAEDGTPGENSENAGSAK